MATEKAGKTREKVVETGVRDLFFGKGKRYCDNWEKEVFVLFYFFVQICLYERRSQEKGGV